MFDAVLIPGGAQSATGLTAIVDAVHFVLEAFKPCQVRQSEPGLLQVLI
jgi:hypothetical protein